MISAMTLPTLVKNHQRQVFVTQLHKVYNEISQAADAYITSKNAIDLLEAGVRNQDGVRDFVQSQLKTVKSCGSTFTDCFANEYSNLSGSTVRNYADNNTSCYVLPSGSSVCMTFGGVYRQNGIGLINLIVDVNGKSGPNIVGRDLFVMGISNNGSVSKNYSNITVNCNGITDPKALESCELARDKSDLKKCQDASSIHYQADAAYCFAQIQEDGFKMNY